jgi:Tfp pilus assembly protein PilV
LNGAVSRQQGYSLLAALVSLALVSFGLLALVRYQSSLFASEAVARDRTEAQMLARQLIDRVYATGNPAAFGSGSDDVQGKSALFKRRWALATGAMGDTAVDVTVNWTDSRGGANDVRLSSVVYKNNPWNQGMLALASDPAPAAPGATIFTSAAPPSNRVQGSTVSSQDSASTAAGAAATSETYHISGSLIGAGGAGVTVSGTNDAVCTVNGGEFDCAVPGAWSGTITVNSGQSNVKVAPSAASYTNVTNDITSQHFVFAGQ